MVFCCGNLVNEVPMLKTWFKAAKRKAALVFTAALHSCTGGEGSFLTLCCCTTVNRYSSVPYGY